MLTPAKPSSKMVIDISSDSDTDPDDDDSDNDNEYDADADANAIEINDTTTSAKPTTDFIRDNSSGSESSNDAAEAGVKDNMITKESHYPHDSSRFPTPFDPEEYTHALEDPDYEHPVAPRSTVASKSTQPNNNSVRKDSHVPATSGVGITTSSGSKSKVKFDPKITIIGYTTTATDISKDHTNKRKQDATDSSLLPAPKKAKTANISLNHPSQFSTSQRESLRQEQAVHKRPFLENDDASHPSKRPKLAVDPDPVVNNAPPSSHLQPYSSNLSRYSAVSTPPPTPNARDQRSGIDTYGLKPTPPAQASRKEMGKAIDFKGAKQILPPKANSSLHQATGAAQTHGGIPDKTIQSGSILTRSAVKQNSSGNEVTSAPQPAGSCNVPRVKTNPATVSMASLQPNTAQVDDVQPTKDLSATVQRPTTTTAGLVQPVLTQSIDFQAKIASLESSNLEFEVYIFETKPINRIHKRDVIGVPGKDLYGKLRLLYNIIKGKIAGTIRDPDDMLAWIPKFSRTEIPYSKNPQQAEAAALFLDAIAYFCSENGNNDAKEIVEYPTKKLQEFLTEAFGRWRTWHINPRVIVDPSNTVWKKERALMVARWLVAEDAYVENVKSQRTRGVIPIYSDSEEWDEKYYRGYLIHVDENGNRYDTGIDKQVRAARRECQEWK